MSKNSIRINDKKNPFRDYAKYFINTTTTTTNVNKIEKKKGKK